MEHRRRTTLLAGTAGLLLAAGLTACGEQPGTGPLPTAPTSTPTPTAITESWGDLNGGNPDDVVLDPFYEYPVLKLGETYTYPDGVAVTISQIGTDVMDAANAPTWNVPAGTEYPIYEVTVTNGTDQVLVPDGTMWAQYNYGPDAIEAEGISVDGANSYFMTEILPGRAYTVQEGSVHPVGDPDLIITMNMGYDRGPVFFAP